MISLVKIEKIFHYCNYAPFFFFFFFFFCTPKVSLRVSVRTYFNGLICYLELPAISNNWLSFFRDSGARLLCLVSLLCLRSTKGIEKVVISLDVTSSPSWWYPERKSSFEKWQIPLISCTISSTAKSAILILRKKTIKQVKGYFCQAIFYLSVR